MDLELNIESSTKRSDGAQGGTRTPTPYGTRSLV